MGNRQKVSFFKKAAQFYQGLVEDEKLQDLETELRDNIKKRVYARDENITASHVVLSLNALTRIIPDEQWDDLAGKAITQWIEGFEVEEQPEAAAKMRAAIEPFPDDEEAPYLKAVPSRHRFECVEPDENSVKATEADLRRIRIQEQQVRAEKSRVAGPYPDSSDFDRRLKDVFQRESERNEKWTKEETRRRQSEEIERSWKSGNPHGWKDSYL
ncbi:MAG: hypothetical protein K9G62_05425 [Alphaproteobacteria bacterium]|nr:hypothetical protein [Alphaproteobacteria bacterium]